MSLEIMKKKVDLKKIEANIAELNYKIEERKEDIKRMQDHIILQDERMSKIKLELEGSN